MFHSSQNAEYLALCEERVRTQYLTWAEQVADIISEKQTRGEFATPFLINDIGCNAGQLWKSLERRALSGLNYRGYDIEQPYLDIFARVFPHMKSTLHLHDIVQASTEQSAITVCSATLEHIDAWKQAVRNICTATTHTVVLRTYLGENTQRHLRMKPNASAPYPIWQFGYAEILDVLAEQGFAPSVIRDRYTDSMPIFLDKGIVRTMYLIIAERHSY